MTYHRDKIKFSPKIYLKFENAFEAMYVSFNIIFYRGVKIQPMLCCWFMN